VRWTVHGERDLYESEWIRLSLVDVETSTTRYEHHAVHAPDAAAVLVVDPDRGVLLLWRHRFLAEEWAWEIPGGMIDGDETPIDAGRRECIEETGWAPGPMRLLYRFRPIAGLSSQTFWAFVADGAEQVGTPDPDESERVEWVPMAEFRRLLAANQMLDGLTVVAGLRFLAQLEA